MRRVVPKRLPPAEPVAPPAVQLARPLKKAGRRLNDDGRLGRMRVTASIDQIRKHWLTWLLMVQTAYGLVNLFGRDDPAHQLLPIAGTCLLAVSVVLVWFGFSVAGASLATIAWSMFTFAALLEPRVDYGYVVLLVGMVGWMALIAYEVGTGLDELRERQQRSSGI